MYSCSFVCGAYMPLCVCVCVCVCVLTHPRWSIAITSHLDTSMTIFVAVDGPLNQAWQTVAARGGLIMPQMILYILTPTCNKFDGG